MTTFPLEHHPPREHLHARARALSRLTEDARLDLLVVGGGATGLGVALDAAARGLKVALLEAGDFAQGTSSRATKLVHGGVRYLAQGHIGLVRQALHERSALLGNAPHLAQPLSFVVPAYGRLEQLRYGVGLKAYEWLAGAHSLGGTRWLGAAATRALLPGVREQGLCGGIEYWDGQFDDARLAVVLARTAAAQGAVVLNRCPVQGLLHEAGRVAGVRATDLDTGRALSVRARCVVNATGVWVDALRALDATAEGPLVTPSQGVHLVVDRSFLPGSHALLVPRTADGRVLFAVPWLGKTVLGTTDTPVDQSPAEPVPLEEEVDFILREAGQVLSRAPRRCDVRSAWVGLRPLVRPLDDAAQRAPGGSRNVSTGAISREHTVLVAPSRLVTVTGGKWTTYRAMAEDVLQRCMAEGLLPERPGGVTAGLRLLGTDAAHPGRPLTAPPGEHLYGSESAALHALPGAARWLARDAETGEGVLSEAMVRFAARAEMAGSVEDVLARRCRLLFLDAAQAAAVAEEVASVLADELGPGFDAQASARALRTLAQQYALVGAGRPRA